MTAPNPEALLIEETGDRAADRFRQLLTLVLLCFGEGEARARAASDSRIVDPVATSLFAEARELLLRALGSDADLRGDLFKAMSALDLAGVREPGCYEPTYQAMHAVVLEALEEVVERELASADTEDDATSERTPGRICN